MNLIQKMKKLGKDLREFAQTLENSRYKDVILDVAEKCNSVEYDWDCYKVFLNCVKHFESPLPKEEKESYGFVMKKMDKIFDDKYVAYGCYPNGRTGGISITIHGIGNTESKARHNAGRYAYFSDYGHTDVAKCSKKVRNAVYNGGTDEFIRGKDGVIYLENEIGKEMKGYKTIISKKHPSGCLCYLENSVKKMF